MLLKFKPETQELEIIDDLKGRLQASRLLSLLIFILGAVKLALLDWYMLTTYDFLFIFLEVIFIYLVVKNFGFKTARPLLAISDIRYYKSPNGLKSRGYFKLKNGRTRELYNLKTKKERDAVVKVVLQSGIALR